MTATGGETMRVVSMDSGIVGTPSSSRTGLLRRSMAGPRRWSWGLFWGLLARCWSLYGVVRAYSGGPWSTVALQSVVHTTPSWRLGRPGDWSAPQDALMKRRRPRGCPQTQTSAPNGYTRPQSTNPGNGSPGAGLFIRRPHLLTVLEFERVDMGIYFEALAFG